MIEVEESSFGLRLLYTFVFVSLTQFYNAFSNRHIAQLHAKAGKYTQQSNVLWWFKKKKNSVRCSCFHRMFEYDLDLPSSAAGIGTQEGILSVGAESSVLSFFMFI